MSVGRCDHNPPDNLSRERGQVGVASQYTSAELTQYFHTIVRYLQGVSKLRYDTVVESTGVLASPVKE